MRCGRSCGSCSRSLGHGRRGRASEAELAAIGSVAGAGPAYVARFIAALAKAGVERGLDPGHCRRRLRSRRCSAPAGWPRRPARRMDAIARRVASPKGTTEAGPCSARPRRCSRRADRRRDRGRGAARRGARRRGAGRQLPPRRRWPRRASVTGTIHGRAAQLSTTATDGSGSTASSSRGARPTSMC